MNRIFVSSILVSCLWIAGCDSGAKTVPAEGTLTLKGAPLPEANIVVMYPDGNSATGVSDTDGKFTLSYLAKNGAVPGVDLKVAVTKQQSPFAANTSMQYSGPPKDDAEAKQRAEAAAKIFSDHMKADDGKKGQKSKDLIDPKYAVPDSSGLKLTIPEGGSKDLKIELP